MRPGACVLLAVPLLALSLAAAAAAMIGAGELALTGRAAAVLEIGRAALTALVCFALAVPVARRRPGILWALPLCMLPLAAASGLAVMPLPRVAGLDVLEGAVLLLPVMVIVLARAWREIPGVLREEARAQGAGGVRAGWIGAGVPAVTGALCGLGAVFLLALGVAPLLAAGPASP